MPTKFPSRQAGVHYLTEGGQETELMYKHEFDLPEFAMYPLLDDTRAVAMLQSMYRAYLDTAVSHGFIPLMGGLDYRASPDWARRLGFDARSLAEMQRRSIDFLRTVAAPYDESLPGTMFVGIVGPRGDAYEADHVRTADESAEYHSVQIGALADAGVDLVEALTFNNIPEAVGVARAAAANHLPACISFTLDSTSRLHTGPSLREAIETVDSLAGPDAPGFYGINCSHPVEFLPALEPGRWFERVRLLRPNAATMDKVSLCTLGHLEVGDPPALGELMGDLARRYPHIDIWGGCCGTWDTHLNEIAQSVRSAHSPAL
jgi:S-methylmethionine-dependent homocysteine/selenocysteine methylase